MKDKELSEEWEDLIRKFSKEEIIGFYRHEKLIAKELRQRIEGYSVAADRVGQIFKIEPYNIAVERVGRLFDLVKMAE